MMIEGCPCCEKRWETGVGRTEERYVQIGLRHPGGRLLHPGRHREFDPWLRRCLRTEGHVKAAREIASPKQKLTSAQAGLGAGERVRGVYLRLFGDCLSAEAGLDGDGGWALCWLASRQTMANEESNPYETTNE